MRGIKKYNRRYFLKRLRQLQGSPYEISAGIACGVAISFTPFVGFHMLLAAVLAWVLRASIISAEVGTLFGNPWTFPFIWVLVLYSGRMFLDVEGVENSVNFLQIFERGFQAVIHWNFRGFDKDIWPIIKPMLIGCVPYFIVSWIATFIFVKRILDKIHARRQKREMAKKGEQI